MKIVAIIAPGGIDFGLNAAFKIACDTLTETGEDVSIFNLATLDFGRYNGQNPHAANNVMEAIKGADGVIFAFPASFFAASSLMQCFIEYFADVDFKDNLKDLLSKYGGEFLVIQNEEIVFHNIDMNIIVAYVEKLEPGSYIIQKCEDEQTQFYNTFHSWVRYDTK